MRRINTSALRHSYQLHLSSSGIEEKAMAKSVQERLSKAAEKQLGIQGGGMSFYLRAEARQILAHLMACAGITDKVRRRLQ